MLFKTNCPNCGAYTEVEVASDEAKLYFALGVLPKDFRERVICCCCLEDGYILSNNDVRYRNEMMLSSCR